MRNFVDWFREQSFSNNKPWLILGKGPSFTYKDRHDLSKFTLVGLNHASAVVRVDFAHVIDVEVLYQAGEAIEQNAKFLIMPAVPHENMQARNDLWLGDWLERIPVLAKFANEERLLWYDITTAETAMSKHPPVPVSYFSSEAVLGLLGLCEIQTIRSLGLDGGGAYAEPFKSIAQENCLKNGHASFDLQFKHFPQILNRFNLDYASLADDSPIRIFIGSSPSEWLPSKVLEFSIRKHASSTVDCCRLFEIDRSFRMPADPENNPRTPFSFQRFLIPEIMNYRGRAIYLDSDMLVMQDISKLWRMPFEGAQVLSVSALNEAQRAVQFSVMLLDCATLKWNIDEIVSDLNAGKISYERLVHKMAIGKCAARISPTWNFLDKYVEGTTNLVHYTNMHTQPWIVRENSAGDVWLRQLVEAIEAGFISIDEIKEQVTLRHVRPSLLIQLKERQYDSCRLSAEVTALDNEFVPRRGGHDHFVEPGGNKAGSEKRGSAISKMIFR